jgi:ADP-heptose:LPS heptosyltransferase
LAPLGAVHGHAFVSLQKPFPPADADDVRLFPNLVDMSSALTDFDETAAIIANLDLVITVDTSMGHLAGAIGKPVWILLSRASDWRWLIDRDDTPWYPTARLFRQPQPGAWAPVVADVVAALSTARKPDTSDIAAQ